MSKAEEFLRENVDMDEDEIREFRGDRLAEIMQQYADGVNRESNKKTAMDFTEYMLRKAEGMLTDLFSESWFDNWLKEEFDDWWLKEQGGTAMKVEEFNNAMNALLLEVDKSIVESIRFIGHEYADKVSRERAEKAFHKGIAYEKGLDVYWDVETENAANNMLKEQEEQP